MKLFACLVISGLFLAGSATFAEQGRGRGRGNDRDGKRETVTQTTAATVVFAQRDAGRIRAHYGNRYKNLPPGLQKKLARGGSLPPGWEKKMEPFPSGLERTLGTLPGGYRRGIYEGHAVIYNPLTHAIVDILSLF